MKQPHIIEIDWKRYQKFTKNMQEKQVCSLVQRLQAWM